MPPDFLPAAEKMRTLQPSPFPLWHILAVFVLTGLFYVAWYMEKFDEATQPVPVPQGIAGPGYQYGDPS